MLRLVSLVMLAAGLLLAATACAPTVPAEDPSIRGTITSITPGDAGGTILVEMPTGGQAFDYDKAAVRVAEDSTVLLMDTEGGYSDATFDDLAEGQTVDVWFTGAVAESYPVQATADVVLIRK